MQTSNSGEIFNASSEPVKWSDIVNLVVSALAMIFAGGAFLYVWLDHQPKPHLEIVYPNRATDMEIADDHGQVTFDLVLRNQGSVDATMISWHVEVGPELRGDVLSDVPTAAFGAEFERIVYLPGPPPVYLEPATYDAYNKIPVPELTARSNIRLGTLTLTAKAGHTYHITTEIDCAECDSVAEGVLTLDIPK